jgi:hypothetical protein
MFFSIKRQDVPIVLGDKQYNLRYSIESIKVAARELHVSVDKIGDKIHEEPASFNTLAVITWAALVTGDCSLKLGQVRRILLDHCMEERAKVELLEAIYKALVKFNRARDRAVKVFNKAGGLGNKAIGPELSIPGRKRRHAWWSR